MEYAQDTPPPFGGGKGDWGIWKLPKASKLSVLLVQ